MKHIGTIAIILLAGATALQAAPPVAAPVSPTAISAAAPAATSSPAPAAQAGTQIYGQYMESRDADVYTGPCFANSEVNLAGHEALLAWHIQQGSWNNVALDGLSVVAVIRASGTLGDEYEGTLTAKALLIVDQNSTEEQRAALESFAQSQAGGLLADVVGVEALPISFEMTNPMAVATLTAGDQVRLATRPVTDGDMICHNEEVFYPPLASHLTHSMPAVSSDSMYSGAALGINWSESGRRGSFLGNFAN